MNALSTSYTLLYKEKTPSFIILQNFGTIYEFVAQKFAMEVLLPRAKFWYHTSSNLDLLAATTRVVLGVVSTKTGCANVLANECQVSA